LVLGRGRRRSISGSRRELLYFWIACFGQLLEAYKLVSRPILGLKDQIDHLLESVLVLMNDSLGYHLSDSPAASDSTSDCSSPPLRRAD
jgi:hypothetical protein